MTTDIQKVDNKKLAKKPLVNLDPEAYAAAVFEPFNERLQTAIAKADGIKYDVTTKEGMATAKEFRAMFRSIRTEGEAERKARKAPILQIGKLLDAKYVAIEAAVTPHEAKFDADIKAEEDRLEEIKVAKLKAEAEAKAAVQARIDEIKAKPLALMSASIEECEAAIAELEQMVPAPELFEERYIEAEYAIKASVDTLKTLIQGKQAQAQLDAQAREQQAQVEAQKVEQVRIDSIKAKISIIKNTFMEAAEKETSAELKAMLEAMPSELDPAEYQEFTQEAEDALASIYKTLNRMITAMENAEKIAAATIEENVEANKKAFLDAVNTGLGATQVVYEDEELSIKPVELYAASAAPSPRIIRTQQPTVEGLVKIVAAACYVSAAEAHAWLVSTDFTTYQPQKEAIAA